MKSKRIKQPWGYTWLTDDGKYHRLDGPAVECDDGSKWWYIDGKRHRLDGPAIERYDGSKWWYVDGKRHRLDGPAVEWYDGDKSWYVNDIMLSEKAFNKHPLVIKHRNRKMVKEWLLT